MTPEQEVQSKLEAARQAAQQMARASTQIKNDALRAMASALTDRRAYILEANQEDLRRGREHKMSQALLDRLLLNESRVEGMAAGLRQVADLADPIGEMLAGWRRPNGLRIRRVRVPIGVIGIIYEARPNVTVDAAALCIKAGNTVLLRGGSEAIDSNRALTHVIATAGQQAGLPRGAIQLVENTDRAAAAAMMQASGLLDLLIPRGGAGLIRAVVQNATVPVIETGVGNCHLFVDAGADLKMAADIAMNAKTQRPSVCNAIETMLVHEAVAADFLPEAARRLRAAGVELRGCERTRQWVEGIEPASEEDWETEYLDLVLAVKVVGSVDEAIAHIQRYGSHHSESIVTRDLENARRFTDELDSAAVYVNASTRFTDGFEFGFGAEIGISTQKLHARGPMGLEQLTTYRYIIEGTGQIRH